MVIMVGAPTFLRDYAPLEVLADWGETISEGDGHVLVDLVEFADVILINKADLVTPAELAGFG